MAPGKKAVEFDAIIKKDRARRQAGALAESILSSKNRRASAPGAGISRHKPVQGASLASRIGVVKRTVSTSGRPQGARNIGRAGNVDAEWTHDLHALNNPSPRGSQLHQRGGRLAARNDRLYNALNGSDPALSSQVNIIPPKPANPITIRGIAVPQGPFVVMAKNFALGTTAADIEAALLPVGGPAASCRLLKERPSVIAEIIFESKDSADSVVDTFNNQNADGQLLHVYHKTGGPAPKIPAQAVAAIARPVTPLGPRNDDRGSYGGSGRYPPDRSRDRSRRDYDSRDDVMDGSYGFEDRMETDDDYDKGRGRGLYSDSLVGNRGQRGGYNNGRAQGDRGRGNNDRGRNYR